MNKGKIYKYDDPFKALARAHQFEYRENILVDFNDECNPQVILSADASKKGLNFCEIYREHIRENMPNKEFTSAVLFSNMLRSEHIPYNIFTPMLLDLDSAKKLFSKLIKQKIGKILDVKIEYAGNPSEKDKYLNDGTSFDAYVLYEMTNGAKGGIGIEVKYTENEYPLGKTEKESIEDASHRYHSISSKSQYYTQELDIKRFITDHHLRQIWRNHILGYSMVEKGDINKFHHIHLYPSGNIHFREKALPEYKKLLTKKGKESFIDLTYEDLFSMMRKYFNLPQQQQWVDYLYKRYLNFSIDLVSNDSNLIRQIEGLKLISTPDNFSGPSVYFHQKAIECARNDNEFLGDRHLEYIYATLVSWGMHRMGPNGATMPSFQRFKDTILAHKSFFSDMRSKTIETVPEEEFEVILEILTTLCFAIEATTSDSRLVSGSKTLAHILPDLVPPIDRQYTLQFFYGTKTYPIGNNDAGKAVFKYIMKYMYKLYSENSQFKKLASDIRSSNKDFCGSLPKIFDNVVINCVSKGITLKREK